MRTDNRGERVIPLLKSALGTIFEHKIILFPFFIIASLQVFILEILYFFPREPLVNVFGPIIRTLWSEEFLHYPYNFKLLPKLFQYVQMPVYVLVSSYLIAVGVQMVAHINGEKKFSLRSVFGEVWGRYIHIFMTAMLGFVCVLIFFKFYGIVYNRAMEIRSTDGPFFLLKQVSLNAAPYLNLLWSVLVTTLLAYMIPVIVIGKKKFFAALVENFKILSGAFGKTFVIVMLPSLLFIPVMWLRNIFTIEVFAPEFSVVTLLVSIVVSVTIDVLIYSTLTIRYLWIAEEK